VPFSRGQRNGSDWNDVQKKKLYAKERESERVKAVRAEFEAKLPTLDAQRLVALDEAGYRLGATTLYGWALSGEPAIGAARHNRCKNETMISAIALDGIRAFMSIEGAMDAAVFRTFVKELLVPNLRPGDCVLMENLKVHSDKQALEAIDQAGATYLFVPPYSPEYNPIEKLWGKVKGFLRRLATDTQELFNEALEQAVRITTTDDLRGWYMHCGYRVAS
jgi:transposase